MSSESRTSPLVQWPLTIALGACMAAGISLAGAPAVSFLGFVLAGLVREPQRARSCSGRLPGRSVS